MILFRSLGYYFDIEGLSIGFLTAKGIREITLFRLDQILFSEIGTEDRTEVTNSLRAKDSFNNIKDYSIGFVFDLNGVLIHYVIILLSFMGNLQSYFY
jgi:hypothetical protein